MERKLIDIRHFTFLVLFLLITRIRLQGVKGKGTIGNNHHRACAYLHCENDDVCVHRKFRCKDPPCPSMLYCARSRTEFLKGPSTCDTVHCSSGYVCKLKVRRCRWDEKCKQQIARCVSRKEFYEGPASCAGFECPLGSHCILRESFCVEPPCKLLRSCAKNKEVHVWLGKCRSLTCSSEFECFLRRPENTCSNPPCKHTPDCVAEFEKISEHCRGWICPRMQKCSAEVVGSCKSRTFDCDIRRTCDIELQNNSLPSSRRFLSNEDQRTESPAIDAKIPRNTNQENVNEKTKIPHSWLNHLNSKTELDAIELWIQNAKEQKDFKQFQDWLRSVKDVLGSSAYAAWIEETLASTSRSEEFRKWLLRASQVHGSLDVDKFDSEREKPILPGRERPQNEVPRALTENRYPVYDTLGPPDNLTKRIEEINSLLKEWNLTNIKEGFLVPNKILLPPYNAQEAALLKNLRESNQFPFFNFILKNSVYKGEEILPHELPKITNTNGQSYYVFPVENVEKPSTSQVINHESDSQHTLQDHRKVISENKVNNGRENNFFFIVPETLTNLSLAKDEAISSFWFGLDNKFGKESPKKETYFVEDSGDVSKNKTLLDKTQYFDDVSVDFLEKLLNNLSFSSFENVQDALDEKSVEQNRQDNSNQHRDSSSVTPIHDYDNPFTNKDSKDVADKLPFYDTGNFTNNSKPIVDSAFFDKFGSIQSSSDSDQASDSLPLVPLTQSTDEENDEMDLNLFFELNKETLLPYIQNLMEAMNQKEDPFNDSEPSTDESSVKTASLNDYDLRSVQKTTDEPKFSITEPKNILANQKSLNEASIARDLQRASELRASRDQNLNNTTGNRDKPIPVNTDLQQEKDPRTPDMIYGDEEPKFRFFYDIPSYGASDSVSVDDYEDESGGRSRVEVNRAKQDGGDVESTTDRGKWN